MEHRRTRKPIPAVDQRPWLLVDEVAAAIGCSSATAHRLRRGEIEGVPRLPSVQVGRKKWVVLKTTLEQWQRENETDDGGLMLSSDRVEIARQRRTLGVR